MERLLYSSTKGTRQARIKGHAVEMSYKLDAEPTCTVLVHPEGYPHKRLPEVVRPEWSRSTAELPAPALGPVFLVAVIAHIVIE